VKLEVLYYDNGRGGTAISVDGGEYVVVRTGRRLLLSETSWEESDEEDCGPLTAEQESAIASAEAKIAEMGEAEGELSEIVLNYRQRRLHQERISPRAKPEKPRREVSPAVMVEYSDLIND